MLEARIRDWGWGEPELRAIWRYIDRQRTPTQFDFRLFGWMVVPAEQLRSTVQEIFRDPAPRPIPDDGGGPSASASASGA